MQRSHSLKKYFVPVFTLCVMWGLPSSLNAEIWDYACAEAMTLLNHAQEDVVQKHNRVYQSTLTLKLFPDGLETCRNGKRGFAGGLIHCVNHRSHGGIAIKEVIEAQQMLDRATQVFQRRLEAVTRSCTSR